MLLTLNCRIAFIHMLNSWKNFRYIRKNKCMATNIHKTQCIYKLYTNTMIMSCFSCFILCVDTKALIQLH